MSRVAEEQLRNRVRVLVAHNSGQNDLELAKIIKRYMDEFKKSQIEIGEIFSAESGSSWTQTRVSLVSQLNDAPELLQKLVADEVIRTTTLVNVIRHHKEGAVDAVLAAIEDAKKLAVAEQAEAETEAREAQRELERITREGDEGKIALAPGKRPIPKLEAASLRIAAAADRVEKAKRVQKFGPSRLTGKEIDLAVARRRPDTKVNPALSRAAIAELLDGIRREARIATSIDTHRRMNELLKRCGFPEVER